MSDVGASHLEAAALSLVVVMENGIYFGYPTDEPDDHGSHRKADARRAHRALELHALVELKQALGV